MADAARTRITVLISGNGSNLQALIDAQSDELAGAHIVRVISNRKAAYGLTRAANAAIPTAYHNLVPYKKRHQQPTSADGATAGTDGAQDLEALARQEYDADLAQLILADAPHLVVCAGFMHILSPQFLDPLAAQGVDVINLHPAKWGHFDGAGAIERQHQAFMDGKITEAGVMIHYVIAEVDRGEALLEAAVPLSHPADDNIEALEERIHKIEHRLIVQGTRKAIDRLQAKHVA